MSEDFLKSPVTFADRDVYIVGSGPNGAPHHKAAQGTVIAINKAIEAVPCESYWLCITSELLYERYFHWMMHDHINGAGHFPIFAQGPLTKSYPETPYYVHVVHPIGNTGYNVIPGHIRRGAGTVGAALQIAHQKQAKRCILIGVDMCGRDYWDGTENITKRSMQPDGTWTQLPALQGVVDWCKANGMGVVSLSETKLNIEVI